MSNLYPSFDATKGLYLLPSGTASSRYIIKIHRARFFLSMQTVRALSLCQIIHFSKYIMNTLHSFSLGAEVHYISWSDKQTEKLSYMNGIEWSVKQETAERWNTSYDFMKAITSQIKRIRTVSSWHRVLLLPVLKKVEPTRIVGNYCIQRQAEKKSSAKKIRSRTTAQRPYQCEYRIEQARSTKSCAKTWIRT